jgi:hypothetical protein
MYFSGSTLDYFAGLPPVGSVARGAAAINVKRQRGKRRDELGATKHEFARATLGASSGGECDDVRDRLFSGAKAPRMERSQI